MALVSGQLNLPVLETCINFQQDKFQRVSIALPNEVISDIIKIQNSHTNDNFKKQQLIENKLSQTQCDGYFFNHDNEAVHRMSFRHLYLETCTDSLDNFIRNHTKENDFQWTTLQEMCYQLVDSVAWLHQSNIYNDGWLNPRNIFVKRSEDAKWKVKLKIPEKLNPFNNLNELYLQLWSRSIKKSDSETTTMEQRKSQEIQRDLISIAILLYFIQTSGAHPFFPGSLNRNQEIAEKDYADIKKQIEVGIFEVDALDKPCFCNLNMGTCEEKMECKYRFWINSLAKDNTKKMLTELLNQDNKQYTNQSVEKLKEHPFFWKTADVLTYMERSSSYLHEGGNQTLQSKFGVGNSGGGNQALQSKLGVRNSGTLNASRYRSLAATNRSRPHQPWILNQSIFLELQNDGENGNGYKHIFEYLHETKNFETERFSLMRNITSFGMLMKQIRNKSCHWNEETEVGNKAKEVLKKIRFQTFQKTDDGKTNFCLFWLIHFPTLLLYTWEQLKDEFELQYNNNHWK